MVLRGFGVFKEVLGGVRGGGSRGVLLYPFKALYAPLKVLHGTRFGSRQYKMAQLANVNWVSITEPFLAGWGPFWGSQRAILGANQALLGPQLSKNQHFGL